MWFTQVRLEKSSASWQVALFTHSNIWLWREYWWSVFFGFLVMAIVLHFVLLKPCTELTAGLTTDSSCPSLTSSSSPPPPLPRSVLKERNPPKRLNTNKLQSESVKQSWAMTSTTSFATLNSLPPTSMKTGLFWKIRSIKHPWNI